MKYLLINGVFRSGTTLLSRALNVHPQCLVISDPFIYFFKAYRNYHYVEAGYTEFHPDEPMSDWFLDPRDDALRRILDSDFSEEMPPEYKEKVRADIVDWKSHQHSELCRRIDEADGQTFADFFDGLMRLSLDIYGDDNTRLLGTKVSWCEEFIPALSRAFPNMKFVFPVRDVRAIVASQNSLSGRLEGKRPLLFYLRHWRKSVNFLLLFASHPSLRNQRFLNLRYEDLIRDARAHLSAICDFLELEFEEAICSSDNFTTPDGSGPWQPNTSYVAGRGFYSTSLDKWRSILSLEQIDAISALAGPELSVMGYEVDDADQSRVFALGKNIEPDYSELADWIKPFSCVDYLKNPAELLREYSMEHVRLNLLSSSGRLDDGLTGRFFVDAEVFRRIRNSSPFFNVGHVVEP